jgi:hypothetical protein
MHVNALSEGAARNESAGTRTPAPQQKVRFSNENQERSRAPTPEPQQRNQQTEWHRSPQVNQQGGNPYLMGEPSNPPFTQQTWRPNTPRWPNNQTPYQVRPNNFNGTRFNQNNGASFQPRNGQSSGSRFGNPPMTNYGSMRNGSGPNGAQGLAGGYQDYNKCAGCGEDKTHPRPECPAWGVVCPRCGRSGHYQTVCRSVQRQL